MTESATNRFLKQIVPQGMTICLARHRTTPDSGRPKLPFRNQFIGAKAVGALAKALDLSTTERDTNWYVAIGGYDNSQRRQAKNVKGIKSLILDVDIKPGPKYFQAKAETFPALQKLHQAVPSLPKPWIIDSGYGLHIYYSLDKTLTVTQWGPIASLFADVVKAVAPKLIADPVRTCDAASVMRLPGSWNAKYRDRKLVTTLREGEPGDVDAIKASLATAAGKYNVSGVDALLDDALLPNLPAIPSYMNVNAPVSFGEGMDNIARQEFKDLDLRPIVAGCKQMREICAAKGNVPEPQWVNFLRVLNTVVNPDDVACHFSSGHPTYNEAATRRKMRHIRQNFDSASTSCKEFRELNPPGCHNCSYAKNIWTPSQLSALAAQQKEITQAVEEAAESAVSGVSTVKGYIPQPSTVQQDVTGKREDEITFLPVRQPGKTGKIAKEAVMAGHIHLVRSSAILSSMVVNHREQSAISDVRVHMDVVAQHFRTRCVISSVDLTSTGYDRVTDQLRQVGVVFESSYVGQRNAIVGYLQNLVKLANNRRVFWRPVKGWLKTGNIGSWSFVAGARHYLPDGEQEDNITSAEHLGLDRKHNGYMERACTGIPRGQMHRWQRGMEVYNGRGLEIAQLLLLSSLSNLLLPLLASNKGGIVLALTGESGKGKTTLVEFMHSFLGDHKRGVIPGSSTSNAIGMLLQQANCMMCAVDDTMSKDGEVFSALLTMVTGGADKMRMTWDSKTGGSVPYEEGFNTSLLLTSNYSTTATIGAAGRGKDQLQTEAARTRTLEFPTRSIIVPDNVSDVDWNVARNLISNNHGHAADKFLRYVVDNQLLVARALRKLETEISARLRRQVETTKGGQVRFWAKFLAVTGMTASIVCNKLHLLPWNHMNILHAGENMVADTVIHNKQSDDDLIESFWSMCVEEPNPHSPVVNIVSRRAHQRLWLRWATASRGERMQRSDWVAKSAPQGGEVILPSAAETNRWRLDSYDIYGNTGPKHRERTVFIPLSELRNLVHGASGNQLPVTDWSDLYTRLRSAGCVILGVLDSQPDRLSKPAVRVNIGIGKLCSVGGVRAVIEIRLPPQTLY